MRDELEQAKKLAKAIIEGKICAIGGIAFDKDMNPLMNTTDLYDAIQILNKVLAPDGFSISRIDAGGSPTWDLTK